MNETMYETGKETNDSKVVIGENNRKPQKGMGILFVFGALVIFAGGLLLGYLANSIDTAKKTKGKAEEQVVQEALEEGITAEDAAREVTLFVEQPEPLVTASESFTPRVGVMRTEEYYEYPDDFSISDEEYRAIFGKVSYVTATNKNIAVITENGDLYMWGKSDWGQIGGSGEDVNTPVKILSDVVSVDFSEGHAAAITQKGDLYLWGNNMAGQVGNGRSLEIQATPVKVLTKVKKVSLGNTFSGALCENGELYTWGGSQQNGFGTDTFKPVKIAEDVADFEMNARNGGYVTTEGVLYMWGFNGWGTAGAGTTQTNIYTPVKIMDGIKSIHISECTTAAIAVNGDLYMWGENYCGQLGAGVENEEVYAPVKVLSNVKSVALFGFHTAAVTYSGNLYMWGQNTNGQLGVVPTRLKKNNYYTPVVICENVENVALGNRHTAAIMKNGDLYMWGINAHQQISDDGTWKYDTPVKIAENMASVAIGWECTYLVDKEGNFYYLGE